MANNGSKPPGAKTIQFPSLEELHANFIIKLNFDDITKYFFFNECMRAYLREDKKFMPFLEEVKSKSRLHKTYRSKKARQLRESEQTIKEKFGLEPEDIQNIFDIIEKEEL